MSSCSDVSSSISRACACSFSGLSACSAEAEICRISGDSSLSRRIFSNIGAAVASAASSRKASRFAVGVWWLADDLARNRIGFRVHVVTEELQRLLGWDQRFFRVLQPFEEFLLREAVLLAREDAEHALTELRIRIFRDLAQGRNVVAAARFECDDAEARRLERLQRRKPHLHGLVLVAKDVQHRLQVLVALTHGQRRFRQGRDSFLDGLPRTRRD